MTLVLQLLRRIATQMGAPPAADVEDLAEETSVEELASQLRENLPEK